MEGTQRVSVQVWRSSRRLRVTGWRLLAAFSVSLAVCSLATAAVSCSWARSLARSLHKLEQTFEKERGESLTVEGLASPSLRDIARRSRSLGLLQRLVSAEAETRRPRQKRKQPGGDRGSKNRFAAHFEVRPSKESAIYMVGQDGVIRDWVVTQPLSRNPLRYISQTGEFTVSKPGVYYLYSQVHCDDNTTAYLKLDVNVDSGLTFRCLEGLLPTLSYSQQFSVQSCQVSGLLHLAKASRISLASIPGVRLKARRFTYFGLFKL